MCPNEIRLEAAHHFAGSGPLLAIIGRIYATNILIGHDQVTWLFISIMQPKKITRLERSICHRFIKLRQILGLGQKELAEGLGFPFDRVVAVENYRTCLKLDVALRLAEKYKVNLGWLAEHAGPVFLRVELDYRGIVMASSSSDSLIDCYAISGIKAKVDETLAAQFPKSNGGETEAARKAITELAHAWVTNDVEPVHLWTFLEEMRSHASRLISAWEGGTTAARSKTEP